MLAENAENKKKILRILKATLVKFKVVYDFACNWLEFLLIEHTVPPSIKTQDEFDQHIWVDVAYNDNDTWHHKQWRDMWMKIKWD